MGASSRVRRRFGNLILSGLCPPGLHGPAFNARTGVPESYSQTRGCRTTAPGRAGRATFSRTGLMNLPNYFLADLPSEATLNKQMLWEACQTLKRNREQYLAERPTRSLIKVLQDIGQNWLDGEYPIRKLALERGPEATGFSGAILARGLSAFFEQLTGDNIEALITHDLGHAQRLDTMVATSVEQKREHASIAVGPEFIAHIAGGHIPNPIFMSIVLGLLTRSAQFVKCASGTSFLPRMFAHSIYDADPKLGACLEIAEWKGGNVEVEQALFTEADCVTATGCDETLAALRPRVPPDTRVL